MPSLAAVAMAIAGEVRPGLLVELAGTERLAIVLALAGPAVAADDSASARRYAARRTAVAQVVRDRALQAVQLRRRDLALETRADTVRNFNLGTGKKPVISDAKRAKQRVLVRSSSHSVNRTSSHTQSGRVERLLHRLTAAFEREPNNSPTELCVVALFASDGGMKLADGPTGAGGGELEGDGRGHTLRIAAVAKAIGSEAREIGCLWHLGL